MKKVIFSILTVITVFALVLTGCPAPAGPKGPGGPGGEEGDLYTVTFNGNGNTGGTVPAPVKQKKENERITLPTNTGNLVKTDCTFGGWSTVAAGTNPLTAGGSYLPTADTTLYAVWTPSGGGGEEPGTDPTNPENPGYTVPTYPPLANDEIVETIGLANGWYAIFMFVLPEGKTWDDYKELTAQYKINAATLAGNARARLMGNFVPAEVAAPRLGKYEENNIAVVGSWPGGASGHYIWDNTWGTDKAITELFTPAPTADTWFTIKYKSDGSNPHAQWNDGNGSHPGGLNPIEGREPKPTYKGPFYVGIGLTGTGNAVVSQIKNVTLVGYDATIANVIGMPLYYKSDGTLYRAYNGQNDDGNLQGGKPSWKIESGDTKIKPIDFVYVPPTYIKITLDLNYEGAPAATEVEIIQDRPLGSDKLALPKREGFLCTGWYDAATGGTKVDDKYIFSANKTIYAQWETFSVSPALSVDDPEIKTAGGSWAEDGWIFMRAANTEDGHGNYDSLPWYAFPAEAIGKGYTHIAVTYEAEIVDGTGEMGVILKDGANQWGDTNPKTYPAFDEGEGVLIWSLDLFIHASNGFSLQYNKGDGKATKYKIKITNITFFYGVVVDAPVIALNGGAGKNDDGWIVMTNGAGNKADGRGEYDSLPNYAFPAGTDAFDMVMVYYEAALLKDSTGEMGTILKNGANAWADTNPKTYPAFGEGKGIQAWDLSLFPASGFSLQYNGGTGKAAYYGLKIPRIVFAYIGE